MSDINKWNTIVRWNNVIAIEQETLKHRSTEWVRASDHDRLMKEKDAEIDRLRTVLEAVRSQMCWDSDRSQLTMGMASLHDDVTKALGEK